MNRHGVLQTKDRVPPRLTSSPKNKHGLVLIISEQLSLGLLACLVQTGSCLCRNKSATIRSRHFAFTKAARLFPQICVCKSVIVIAMLQRLQACCPENRSHRSTDALGSSPRLELPIRSLPEPVSEQGTRNSRKSPSEICTISETIIEHCLTQPRTTTVPARRDIRWVIVQLVSPEVGVRNERWQSLKARVLMLRHSRYGARGALVCSRRRTRGLTDHDPCMCR